MNLSANILAVDDESSIVSYKKSNILNDYQRSVSLEELIEIFKENPTDIYKCNTSKCLTFIDKSGIEISLNEYQDYPDKMNLKLCRISNEIMKKSGNDIIISLMPSYGQNCMTSSVDMRMASGDSNHTVFINIRLIDMKPDLDNIPVDIDGYGRTCKMTENPNLYSKKKPLAINYCISKTIKTDVYNYDGYLPSLGQMMVLMEVMPIICHIRKMKPGFLNSSWWTSTVFSAENTCYWIVDGSSNYIKRRSANVKHMMNDAYVFPVFRQVKKS